MRDAARRRRDGGCQKRQEGRRPNGAALFSSARYTGLVLLSGAAASAASSSAIAADPLALIDNLRQSQDVIGLSFIVGLVLFSTITALLHLRERHQWSKNEAAFSLELNNLRAKIDRADVFLAAEPQIIVAWGGPGGDADIEGDLSLVTDVPISRRVLGFGSWLAPDRAQKLDDCVERLRQKGESFRFALESLGGRRLEIEGRAVSGRAVMRIRDVSGDRLEAVRLRERLVSTIAELELRARHAERH